MVYSGMPIAEQSRYTGEKYLPALAGLKQQQADKQTGLQSSLADIAARQAQQAYSIREQQMQREMAAQQAELDRQQKERQFQMELAARRSSGGGSTRQPSAAERWAAAQQDMARALDWAKQNPTKVADGYREQVGQKIAATYGIPYTDVMKQAGQYFPNGWEWQAGIRK